MKLVGEWTDRAKIDRGPLLRPVYQGHPTPPGYMNTAAIGRTLKKLAQRASLDPIEAARISDHSLGVGAAQQLTLNGVQILPIMRAGDGARSTWSRDISRMWRWTSGAADCLSPA